MQKPNHGVIYIAKQYPPWQHTALVTLKKLYDENNEQFPDNKQIMNVLKGDESVKKHMKKLMPFVQHVKVTSHIDHKVTYFPTTLSVLRFYHVFTSFTLHFILQLSFSCEC